MFMETQRWTCPKCRREFSRKDQPHFCGKPQTVDEYIDSQDATLQPKLKQIRLVLQTALPAAEERISWSMPTYWEGRNLIHFAANKNHIGLYPGGEATDFFACELQDFDVSKGTIRLSFEKELPVELIIKIAKWCENKYKK